MLIQVGRSIIVVVSFANAYSAASYLCWEREAFPSQFALQLYLILSKVGCGGAQGISNDFFRHDIWCCTIEQCKLAIANIRFQVTAIIKRGK